MAVAITAATTTNLLLLRRLLHRPLLFTTTTTFTSSLLHSKPSLSLSSTLSFSTSTPLQTLTLETDNDLEKQAQLDFNGNTNGNGDGDGGNGRNVTVLDVEKKELRSYANLTLETDTDLDEQAQLDFNGNGEGDGAKGRKVTVLDEKRKVPNLTAKEKKELGSYASTLGDKLKSQQIGKFGVTDKVAFALSETLEKNELLKLKIHKSCPGELEDVVKQVEQATGSIVVGQIARTVILYRPSVSKLKAHEKREQHLKLFAQRKQKAKTAFMNQRKDQISRHPRRARNRRSEI